MTSRSPTPRLLLAATSLALALVYAPAVGAQAPPIGSDPRAIMERVEGRSRGDRLSASVTLTLLDAAGRQRERTLRMRGLAFEAGRRQLMLFDSPADVQGTGLLSVDYDDGDRDDEQWLYLPSLKRSTRISSGDKSGSFVGTDFSYADLTRSDPKHWDYTLLKEVVVVSGEACWLIEARPRTERAKEETGYLKMHLWISKEKQVPLQAKMWVAAGRRLKYVSFNDYRKVSGVWLPHELVARTRQGKRTESTTVLRYQALRLDDPAVKPEEFTQRRLEQGL